MATRTISAIGGKWSEVTAWAEAEVPTASDDVVATGTSGNLTIAAEAFCRSIDLTGYTGTLKHESFALKIGTSTAQGEGTALKFPTSGWTYNATGFTGAFKFSSSAASEQTIDFGGKQSNGNIQVEGMGATFKLLSALTVSVSSTKEIILAKGTLNLNGQAVSTGRFKFSVGTRKLIGGASVITLGGTGSVFNVEDNTSLTLELAEATIKVTNTSATEKQLIGRATSGLPSITLASGVGGTVTIGASNSNSWQKFKVEGTGPNTIHFGKELTQTFTEWEATGSAGELITIESTESGKPWTLQKTSGTVISDFLKLKDSHAEGGATFYAGSHSENVSGNEGWKFEDKPSESTGPPIGSRSMMGVGR